MSREELEKLLENVAGLDICHEDWMWMAEMLDMLEGGGALRVAQRLRLQRIKVIATSRPRVARHG